MPPLPSTLDGFDIRLTDKVAIVTGAASGIGEGAARSLAAAGASVVITDVDADKLGSVEREIADAGGKVAAQVADVRDAAYAPALVELALERFGKLTTIVPSAGVYDSYAIEDQPLDSLDRMIGINIRGPYLLAQAATPELRKTGDGSIIFIASNASFVGFNDSSAYCTTKGAVRIMTLAFAAELAQHGVRVNAIAPGTIDTPMNHFWFADKAKFKAVEEAIPAKRIGTVDDLNGAVLYLASDASRWTHGAIIPIEGGWLAV
jgi:3-oxoacyl-[acyl-carrier protein] reductase